MGCNTLKMYLNDKTFNLKLALELFSVDDEGGDGGPVVSVLVELNLKWFKVFVGLAFIYR